MMNNAAIAFDHMQITPGEWLAQVDAGVHATFQTFIVRGQYREAYLFLGAHLAKTETTRRRIHGDGPTLADACAAYTESYYQNWHAVAGRLRQRISVLVPSSGASHGDPCPVWTLPGRDPKDSDLTAPDPGATVEPPANASEAGAAPVSCAPDENRLRDLLDDIEGPEPCDHQRGRWTCIRGVHPFNPNGHVYVSTTGSHVPDRHGDES